MGSAWTLVHALFPARSFSNPAGTKKANPHRHRGPAFAAADSDEQIEVLRVPAGEALRYLEEATSLAALALHREELPA